MSERFDFSAGDNDEPSFRWPEQFAESQARLASLSKAEAQQLKQLGDWVNENLVACQIAGLAPHSQEVQRIVAEHVKWVSVFWDPDKAAYLKLADMYVEDHRYRVFYERINAGLSEYLSLAMKSYANSVL